jgi:hypothetical protein
MLAVVSHGEEFHILQENCPAAPFVVGDYGWLAGQMPLFAECLIRCSEVSQETEYPKHNMQEFGVRAEFVYFKEGGMRAYC